MSGCRHIDLVFMLNPYRPIHRRVHTTLPQNITYLTFCSRKLLRNGTTLLQEAGHRRQRDLPWTEAW
jgi:hypothetical protein